jgi:hypothetical protein
MHDFAESSVYRQVGMDIKCNPKGCPLEITRHLEKEIKVYTYKTNIMNRMNIVSRMSQCPHKLYKNMY